ncbi:hypothetical protein THAOC_18852 [Thalassiosira oceanica]|uniref:Uncharacterized protein n=1 Tax=Thalassiosira oceanica TaxID=159749 RepID=K0SR13_THAOC|nr:hypothetical protein THAOC_18852 [Thalassiosira oceanica]|eukprot:EJK60742.1 hypothetical protein THAOC_18852 [Thalassiosira oceanica]
MTWWSGDVTDTKVPNPPEEVQRCIANMSKTEWKELENAINQIRAAYRSGVDLLHAVSLVIFLASKVSDGLSKLSYNMHTGSVLSASPGSDLDSEEAFNLRKFVSPFSVETDQAKQRICSVKMFLSEILCLSKCDIELVKEKVVNISKLPISMDVGNILEDVWQFERTKTKLYVLSKEDLAGHNVIVVGDPVFEARYRKGLRANSQPGKMKFKSISGGLLDITCRQWLATSIPVAIVTTLETVKIITSKEWRSLSLVYSDSAKKSKLGDQVVLLSEIKQSSGHSTGSKSMSELMKIAQNAKASILSHSKSHNDSSGDYFGEGSRDVTQINEGCSFGDYVSVKDGSDTLLYAERVKQEIIDEFGKCCDAGIIAKNVAVNGHHKAYHDLFCKLKEAGNIMDSSDYEDSSPTYRCYEQIGNFPCYFFNNNASTAQFHTEEDTSYTLVHVSQVSGNVFFSFQINDRLELRVPYTENLSMMFSASLLTHKQVMEKGSAVINFSAYGKRKLEQNAFLSLRRCASKVATKFVSFVGDEGNGERCTESVFSD